MDCTLTLKGQEGVIYGLSWAPSGDDRLVSASSKGELCIWDTIKGVIIARATLHKDSMCARVLARRGGWSGRRGSEGPLLARPLAPTQRRA